MLTEEEIVQRFEEMKEDIFELYRSGLYYSNWPSSLKSMVRCLDVLIPDDTLLPWLMDLMAHHMAKGEPSDLTRYFAPLENLLSAPFNHPVTEERARLICDRTIWPTVRPLTFMLTDRVERALTTTPSRQLYDLMSSLSPKDNPWPEQTPYLLIFEADEQLASKLFLDEPKGSSFTRLWKKWKLSEEEMNLLAARLYQCSTSAHRLLAYVIDAQRKYHYKDRQDSTLARVLSNIHDAEMIPFMYEFTRKGYGDMKPYLEAEGANAIEGLVAMCVRKSAKRDFAVHILSSYVEQGFSETIRTSMKQLPKAARQNLEEELFGAGSSEPDVSGDPAPAVEQHYAMDEQEVKRALHLLQTFPFDRTQKIELSYGGRSFKITLDRTASVSVLDKEKHEALATLPPARADEDAYHINLIKDRLKLQKREAKKAATAFIKGLEESLRNATTWSKAEWEAMMSSSALNAAIAASFVWGTYDAEYRLKRSFYRDIEGNYIDTSYEPVKLPSSAQIALVHPLDLSKEEIGAWSTFMAELEYVQLFDQLSRRCFPPETWEHEKQWQEEVFDNRESMCIDLRKHYPGWYASYFKGRYNKKYWFSALSLHTLQSTAVFIVHDNSWPARDGGEPHRTGLHFNKRSESYKTDKLIPWENYPARTISELLLDIHGVAERYDRGR